MGAKAQQVKYGIDNDNVPTRKELEQFSWKTGRVIRLLIKPESSKARKLLWSECKGVLKKVLVIEKFNSGVFIPECVRQDVIETKLLTMLEKLRNYLAKRQTGDIAPPDE